MIKYDNWHFKMIVKEKNLPAFERALDGMASALLASKAEKGPNRGMWLLEAIFQDQPDIDQLDMTLNIVAKVEGIETPDYLIGPLPNKNWLKDSLLNFPPLTIGGFYIYGSHIEKPLPEDKINIKIDAATAFGSGEHPTTAGCLKAMDALVKKKFTPARILDMGCGSGILSIAAAKAFNTKVYAVDVDDEAVRLTGENAIVNGVGDLVETKSSNGYRSGFVRTNGPYDLILSNILAKPLIRMAPSSYKNLAKGGVVIISGLLTRQEEWVSRAYEKQGFVHKKSYQSGEWSTLVYRRK